MRILALLFSLLSLPVWAQPLPLELLTKRTVTETEVLQRTPKMSVAAAITGRLYLPAGSGKFPAMIILHASEGDRRSHDDWVRVFDKAGIEAVPSSKCIRSNGRGVGDSQSSAGIEVKLR